MKMSEMQLYNIKKLPIKQKINFMHFFLSSLTLEVRFLIFNNDKYLKLKLQTINEIQNMILDYIIPMSQEKDTSYTDEIIAQNLIDMAEQYELSNEILSAWVFALSCVFPNEDKNNNSE